MKQDPVQMFENYRHLVNKLVYIKLSNDYMATRLEILKELLRFACDFEKGSIDVDSYKDSFKIRKIYIPDTYEICTAEFWTISINKNSVKDLVLFLKSEGLNIDEHESLCQSSKESLVGRE